VKHLTPELFLFSALVVLAGCATRAAPDIGGKWRAVNHYAEMTEAIPLYQTYVFYSSPMDGTLKGMLTRWAKDSKMTLSYLHPTDFTLYVPVAQIRTPDVAQAVSLLNVAYAAQRVSITVDGRQIVVRAAETPGTAKGAVPSAAQAAD
jgi:hypothetical protein